MPVSKRISRVVERTLRLLQKWCWADRPLVVQHGEVRWWADTGCRTGSYLVRLDRSMDERTVEETIVHEWAHAMMWPNTKIDHGEVWGRAYSRCYRVVFEKWRPRNKMTLVKKKARRKRLAGRRHAL